MDSLVLRSAELPKCQLGFLPKYLSLPVLVNFNIYWKFYYYMHEVRLASNHCEKSRNNYILILLIHLFSLCVILACMIWEQTLCCWWPCLSRGTGPVLQPGVSRGASQAPTILWFYQTALRNPLPETVAVPSADVWGSWWWNSFSCLGLRLDFILKMFSLWQARLHVSDLKPML